MAWIIIFVSFIGPLYDSNGYVTGVHIDETQVFESKTSCTYTSNFIKLEKTKSLCITLNEWNNISRSNETNDFSKIDIDLLLDDF